MASKQGKRQTNKKKTCTEEVHLNTRQIKQEEREGNRVMHIAAPALQQSAVLLKRAKARHGFNNI